MIFIVMNCSTFNKLLVEIGFIMLQWSDILKTCTIICFSTGWSDKHFYNGTLLEYVLVIRTARILLIINQLGTKMLLNLHFSTFTFSRDATFNIFIEH